MNVLLCIHMQGHGVTFFFLAGRIVELNPKLVTSNLLTFVLKNF